MRGRLLCKIGREAARLRRQRRKDTKAEVSEVIRSFLQATNGGEHAEDNEVAGNWFQADEGELHRSADDPSGSKNEAADASQSVPLHAAGGDSDEEFWMNLPTVSDRTCRIQNVPVQANRLFPGMMVRSRMSMLRSTQVRVSAVQVEDVA